MSIWSSRIVDPGLMTSLMTSSLIIIVANLGLNISETRPDSGMVSRYSEQELAYGLSIMHGPENVTRPDDVIMVTSPFISLNASFPAILVRTGRYFNMMFPCMVYGPHG